MSIYYRFKFVLGLDKCLNYQSNLYYYYKIKLNRKMFDNIFELVIMYLYSYIIILVDLMKNMLWRILVFLCIVILMFLIYMLNILYKV